MNVTTLSEREGSDLRVGLPQELGEGRKLLSVGCSSGHGGSCASDGTGLLLEPQEAKDGSHKRVQDGSNERKTFDDAGKVQEPIPSVVVVPVAVLRVARRRVVHVDARACGRRLS